MRVTPSTVAAVIALFGISVTLGSPTPRYTSAQATDKLGVCLRICSSEQSNCPDGWNAQQLGECWTCCTDVYLDGTNGGATAGITARGDGDTSESSSGASGTGEGDTSDNGPSEG